MLDRTISTIVRPSLGRLRFDTGGAIELDRPALLGRKPPDDQLVNGERAVAVAIPDPEHALSRLHLEVRLEGWAVVVVDRRSTNASIVTLPDAPPARLAPDEPRTIVPGTTIRLGDVVTLTYEP